MTDSLVLSLRDLPRQIGSTLERSLTWVAPEDLGTPSMRVVPGTPIALDVTLTSVDDGVLVQVTTDVTLEGECVRCLDPVVRDHHLRLSDVCFEPEGRAARSAAPSVEDEDGEGGEDLWLIGERDTVDLEPLLRDGIIPLVEDRPLCTPDCEGLCQGCGEKWADLPEGHAHEVIDPRLASLASLLPGDFLASLPTDEDEDGDEA